MPSSLILPFSAMLSIPPFQLCALLFLIFGSLIGSDPGLRVGDTPSLPPYDGIDRLGNLASPDLASTNEVSAGSPNSDSNQQSSSVPAHPQSYQCPPENKNIPSGKRRRRRQLPRHCPQPLAPIGEAHQQQRQNNNGDIKIHTGPFRGRKRKKPDPNILPDVLILSPEREQKRPGDICPPTHPPINGVIPLTIPLCALDQYAKPDNHAGYAGMYALEDCNPCTLYSFSFKWLFCLLHHPWLFYLTVATGNQFYGCVPFETLWCCTKQVLNVQIPQHHIIRHHPVEIPLTQLSTIKYP